jgi:hypothetical protein
MVAPVLIDAQGNQTEDILKTEAWASIPSASEHVSGPVDNQFKDTGSATAPNHGSYPIQTRRRVIHQPILFSKQRDYGQLRKTFDADATLHSVSLPNDTPYIPAMFGILSFSLYRYAWYPLSLTVSILTLVYVFVRYRYK